MKKLFLLLALVAATSLAFADNYSEEPTQDTTINITGTFIAHMDVNQPAQGLVYHVLNIYQDEDKQEFHASIAFNPFENGSAAGTYTLATDDQHVGAGQFAPSSGVHDSGIYPSYVARFIGGMWDTEHIYFIMGGNMSISYPESGIMEVNATFTTYNGSIINVSYRGSAEDMPTAVDNVTADPNEVYGAEGVLHFAGEGSYRVYNLSGAMLYDGSAETLELPAGAYMVRTANSTYKIVL